MRIQLSDHYTYGKLILFTLPSIAMMIFISIYGIVDGFFVANYVGDTPFAALNLVMPFIMLFPAVGFMIGTGGSALVAMTLGTGNRKKANELFSLLVYLLVALGSFFTIVGIAAAEPVSRLLGATDAMLPYCVLYIRICMLGLIPFMLQSLFQSFLITAERPKIGFYVTIAAGVTNMFCDWLFMGVMGMGLGSAAAATVLGLVVGGGVPLLYFALPNQSLLRLGKTHMDWRAVKQTLANGSSEFMSNISISLVSMLYNLQLMRFAGQNGVAAYGIIMYTDFVFVAIFMGYSMGITSIVGYHFGAQNRAELQSLLRKSLALIGAAGIAATLLPQFLATSIANIFTGGNAELFALTVRAIHIHTLCFLFMGFNLFGSAFFTALNDGLVSAKISFLRTLVFESLAVLAMPLLFGLNGIWASIVVAEILGLLVTTACLYFNRKKYGYMAS